VATLVDAAARIENLSRRERHRLSGEVVLVALSICWLAPHHIGAAAQAPEVRFLALDLLGEFVAVARGFVSLEADSAKFICGRSRPPAPLLHHRLPGSLTLIVARQRDCAAFEINSAFGAPSAASALAGESRSRTLLG
jgi:hypothetical protein